MGGTTTITTLTIITSLLLQLLLKQLQKKCIRIFRNQRNHQSDYCITLLGMQVTIMMQLVMVIVVIVVMVTVTMIVTMVVIVKVVVEEVVEVVVRIALIMRNKSIERCMEVISNQLHLSYRFNYFRKPFEIQDIV